MPKSLLKLQDYVVHSVSSCSKSGQQNANIVTWLMQSAMKGKCLTVALFKTDLTIELVKESGILNVNFLAANQTKLIKTLGRSSGRDKNKLEKVPFALDERNCPYLLEAIGFIKCQVIDTADSLDHEIFVCKVLGQKILNPELSVLTLNELRRKNLVRG
jgi:flavin reductase (DIM6/NTAB) family NADH-FMN oxidoreductase RutF